MKTTRLLLQMCRVCDEDWTTLLHNHHRSEMDLKTFALQLKKADEKYGVESRYRIIRETTEVLPIFETGDFSDDHKNDRVRRRRRR